MKLKTKKTKVLFSLALLIIFLFSSIFNSRFSKNIISNNNYLEFKEKDQVQIKLSGFWNLTGSPIFIDDSDTNYNWSKTAFENDWCSGSGSWADPYVIENVTIDGQGSSNCIEIWFSDAYFIIRNCSLYNSNSPFNAGIKLSIVDNGKIINNNCSDNKGNGIYLYYSYNNTISGNNASNNNYHGIYLHGSDNSTIAGNNASNNNEHGIYLYISYNNTISGNNASNNYYCGIFLFDSNNNTLSGNNANNNERGIYLANSDNSTLSGNLMNFCGISLSGSLAEVASHSIDITNLVNSKPVYYCVNEIGLESSNFPNAGQIILINCNNSIISGLNLSNGTTGIYLGYSNNNTLSGNIACNNTRRGLYLDDSNNNTLSGNIANNNGYGIFLWDSSNSTISGNNASNNNYNGINLRDSDNNALSRNTANNNSIHGIYLSESDNNTVLGNTANNNGVGINLWESDNNKLLENNASYNINNGIDLGYSKNSTISENTANNNKFGIYLEYSDNNTLSGNNASNNTYGIFLYGSNNNTLSGNTASNNTYGIFLYGSNNNTLSRNAASNNNYYGIYLMESNYNTISGNIISNNPNGTRLDSNSNDNKIFLNHFINNEIDAEDNGMNNMWDDGVIGNYWDDYTGVDANDDGIGDTPYIIPGTAGSRDNFPIWTDGDDLAPVITIISPLHDGVFGLDAPNYQITINELNLDTIWYTLDGGITNYTITGLTGTFNQTAWGALSEGNVTIRFYANDTAGNIGFTDVEIIIEIPEDVDDLPIISFGNYYILFTFITITILSFIILEKRKKK